MDSYWIVQEVTQWFYFISSVCILKFNCLTITGWQFQPQLDHHQVSFKQIKRGFWTLLNIFDFIICIMNLTVFNIFWTKINWLLFSLVLHWTEVKTKVYEITSEILYSHSTQIVYTSSCEILFSLSSDRVYSILVR